MFQAGQINQYDARCFLIIGNGEWIPWTVPKEAKFISFTLAGAGCGGDGGSAGLSTNAAGGGGGGSGSLSCAVYPGRALPSTIYFNLAIGSPGGAGAVTNGTGTPANPPNTSFITSTANVTTSACTILLANSGNPSNGSGGGGGGSAGTVSTMFYAYRAILLNLTSGAAGGSHHTNAGASLQQSIALTGGAGGGRLQSGTANDGSPITSGDQSFTLNSQTIISGGTSGGIGGIGFNTIQNSMPFGNTGSPWQSYGGGGGGSVTSGTGGNGGDGSIGSGGGGGGAAGNSGTGGTGGTGGASFCLIEWW